LQLLYPTQDADSERRSAEVRTAAFLSQGSMLAAGRYLTGALREVRDRAFAILLAAADSDGLELLQLANTTARGYAAHRHLFPVLLQLLASVARDAMLVAEGAAALPPGPAHATSAKNLRPTTSKSGPTATTAQPLLVHGDRGADLQQLAQAFDAPALRHIVRQAQRAERQIAGYAHAELTLGSFFLGLARARTAARTPAARV